MTYTIEKTRSGIHYLYYHYRVGMWPFRKKYKVCLGNNINYLYLEKLMKQHAKDKDPNAVVGVRDYDSDGDRKYESWF